MSRLAGDFFAADAVTIARDLLGKSLLRRLGGEILGGIIVETEAYVGEEDSACHASRGCTPRTRVMYGAPGHYYVYLIYGMYHMLNIVTGDQGHPQAVLIRSLQPVKGIKHMQNLRGNVADKKLCDGPGKLCQALAIDRQLNALPVESDALWLEAAPPQEQSRIIACPRVGIGYASAADQQKPWRFFLRPDCAS